MIARRTDVAVAASSGTYLAQEWRPTGQSRQCPSLRSQDTSRHTLSIGGHENGRCRMHGGMSTGPLTAEGIERIRAARTKHGRHSQASIAKRREARAGIRTVRALVRSEATTVEEMERSLDALNEAVLVNNKYGLSSSLHRSGGRPASFCPQALRARLAVNP